MQSTTSQECFRQTGVQCAPPARSRRLPAVPTTLVSGYTDHNVRDVMFDTVIVKMSHVGTEVSEPTWCSAPGAVLPPWPVPGVTLTR